MLPNANFKPVIPSTEERVPVHATQDELVEFYEHTHYAAFPDIFAMLVLTASIIFLKHSYEHTHRHIVAHAQRFRAARHARKNRRHHERNLRHAIRATS